MLGFLFDGFFTDGTIVEDIPSDLIIPVIEKTMVLNMSYLRYLKNFNLTCNYTNIFHAKKKEHLPSDKMKIIFGAWTPSLIIDLINSGIDMFDSSFPYLTTERKSALIFDYNLKYK